MKFWKCALSVRIVKCCIMHMLSAHDLFPCLSFLHDIFLKLGFAFSFDKFIFGYATSSLRKPETALVNFLIAEAKMSIYKTGKNKGESGDLSAWNIILTDRTLISSRIQLEYLYCSRYGKEQDFIDKWCVKNVLCCATK